MKTILQFTLLFFLFACKYEAHDPNRELNEDLDRQLAKRYEVITTDSSLKELQTVKEETARFILLSKDVENIKASINKANVYFVELARQYEVDSSDLIVMGKDTPLDEIVTNIKKNELNILTKIILKKSKNGVLFTAQ
jgi:hypothetical protein